MNKKIKLFNNLVAVIRNDKIFEFRINKDSIFIDNSAIIEYLKEYSNLCITVDQTFSNLRNKLVIDYMPMSGIDWFPRLDMGFKIYEESIYFLEFRWFFFYFLTSSCFS